MSSAGDVGSPQQATPPLPEGVPGGAKPRLQSPLDYRNGDLVSRLLAATPPYLYNMPLVPHSFFFSEMLRSFVQAKTEGGGCQPGGGSGIPMRGGGGGGVVGAAQQQRRSRKRSWRESSNIDRMKPMNMAPIMDKPLELTTTSRAPAQPPPPPPPPPPQIQEDKVPHPPSPSTPPTLPPPPPPLLLPPCGLLPLPSPDTSLPPDMLLPPPPPLWYPPLYPLPPQPPYGIDPLHFFIDLRVSGHIWDRKLGKDNPGGADSLGAQSNGQLPDEKPLQRSPSVGSSGGPSSSSSSSSSSSLVKQSKHCSAFSVPQPRAGGRGHSPLSPPRQREANSSTTTNYILQNLSRIYTDVRRNQQHQQQQQQQQLQQQQQQEQEQQDCSDKSEHEGDQSEEKPRCKDLRALIGLELVVDYVKHEGGKQQRPCDSPAGTEPATASLMSNESNSSSSSSSSSSAEVIAEKPPLQIPTPPAMEHDVMRQL